MLNLASLEQSPLAGAELRREAMKLLAELPGYDWCGIYRLEGDVLFLGEFVGEETEHTRIAVGVGVCGTAVSEGRNQIVEDVSTLSNYLSCSITTRSEIVVLIRDRQGKVLGQIDADGHQVGAFGHQDEQMLEELAAILASRWH